MKLAQLIYDIKEAVNDYTDDSNISNKYLEYLYQIKRSKYISQDMNKMNKSVDDSIIQSLCLSLEEVPVTSCGVSLGCDTLLRTKLKVPTLIDLNTKTSIISIRPTTRIARPFNFVDRSRLYNIEGSPYKESIYVFYEDRYIYVYSHNDNYKHLSCIELFGVFEDPLELEDYPKCCNCDVVDNPCFDRYTMDYPIQSRYIDIIRDEIVQEILRKKQIPEDKENDATNIVSGSIPSPTPNTNQE